MINPTPECPKFVIINKMTLKGILESKSWKDESIIIIDSKETDRSKLEFLRSQLESKLAKADERLTPLGIKWVQCLKCRKDYVEFYPKQQCTCGSYESEEVDALLTDLLEDSRKLKRIQSQHTNLVKAIQDRIDNYNKSISELADKINSFGYGDKGILIRKQSELYMKSQELQNLLERVKA